LETVAAAKPDIVVLMPCGYDAPRAHEEAMEFADRLRELGASRLVAVNASAYFSRPGPRLVDGVELLGEIMHPQQLAGIGPEGQSIDLQELPARS
jgi:iron complex transport system substrate-binding protein